MTCGLRSVPRRWRIAVALLTTLSGTLGLAGTPSAGAATQIGETSFETSAFCSSNRTIVQSASPGGQYAAPSDGVITSWSFQGQASNVPQGLKLKVARPAGFDSFTIVGESDVENPTPNALNTYNDVGIPVQVGDVIGLYSGTGGTYCRIMAGYGVHTRIGDLFHGATDTFPLSDNAIQLNVSATLEPDCDGDGLGDETQDPNAFGISCPPKARTLTLDANKNKVKKGKRVLLSGHLDSAEQACESGQTVDLQRKRPSQTTFTTVEQLQTNALDNFSTKQKVKKTFEYRAQVGESGGCDDQISNTEKVKVKKKR